MMPTTIVAQNGIMIKQKTTIVSVSNCPVRIVKDSTTGATAIHDVQLPAAGQDQRFGHRPQDHLAQPGRRRAHTTSRCRSPRRRRSAQIPPAADQGARRLRAEEQERQHHLQGVRHGDVQGLRGSDPRSGGSLFPSASVARRAAPLSGPAGRGAGGAVTVCPGGVFCDRSARNGRRVRNRGRLEAGYMKGPDRYGDSRASDAGRPLRHRRGNSKSGGRS